MDILVFKSIFYKFILLPLIVIILGGILLYCRKKVPKIKNKTLIFYILISAFCLSLLGFLGIYGNMFSPYLYLFSMIIYLFLGVLNVNLLHKYFSNTATTVSFAFSVFFETLITIIIMVLASFIFYHIFNWISPYEGYATMAATCISTFIIPLAFYYCYLHFISIPFDIYKTWQYTPGQQPLDIEGIDYDKLMVLNFELTKKIDDGTRSNIKAKAPANGVSFGDWFFKVVFDYNHKNPDSIIHLLNEEQESFTWVFYVKKSIFHLRRFIDFDKDIATNKISESNIIICKRVANNIQDNTSILK